jgi:hypothetical protein
MPTDEHPPRWAESRLRLLLKPDDRDSVSGDLLEEYRESKRPANGRRRANIWYIGQVANVAWREAAWFGLVAGAALGSRFVLDALVPLRPTDYGLRAAVLSWSLLAIFSLAGLRTAWRTGHVRAAVLVAMTASVIHSAIGLVVAGVLAVLNAPTDPGGRAEIFIVPLIALVASIVAGTAGGVVGKVLRSTTQAVARAS